MDSSQGRRYLDDSVVPYASSPFSLLTLQEGNINLINAAKKAGIKKFILVSPFNRCLHLMCERIGRNLKAYLAQELLPVFSDHVGPA